MWIFWFIFYDLFIALLVVFLDGVLFWTLPNLTFELTPQPFPVWPPDKCGPMKTWKSSQSVWNCTTCRKRKNSSTAARFDLDTGEDTLRMPSTWKLPDDVLTSQNAHTNYKNNACLSAESFSRIKLHVPLHTTRTLKYRKRSQISWEYLFDRCVILYWSIYCKTCHEITQISISIVIYMEHGPSIHRSGPMMQSWYCGVVYVRWSYSFQCL